MEKDVFKLISEERYESNTEIWLPIRSHTKILIQRWARSQRLELDWTASERGIGDPELIIDAIFQRLKSNLISGALSMENYQSYNEAVLMYAGELIQKQFIHFSRFIRENDSLAWRRVYERLRIYAAKWYSDRNFEADLFREIFQESMLTLVEKISEKNLEFKSSKEMKSFFFRILELKTLEFRRKNVQQHKRDSDTTLYSMMNRIDEESFTEDDRYLLVKRILSNSLPEDERYILKQYYFHGEKLSDIARSLGISDTNCRQKKYQAIQRIRVVFRSNTGPYGM